ncbi:MAG: hypothetical protein ABN482_06235 [Corticimicrobacter sp.]|uniref:hypothetical protein n=1 Tax=Corticimicrobacter sp. TaxID=2678536 RepID=UPI0032DB3E7E
MEERNEVVPVTNAEIMRKPTEERNLELLAALASNLAQPFAESQKVVATEATKRHEISAKAGSRMIFGAFLIGVLIIDLAYMSLYQGNAGLAEKIVVAVIGFLAGLGVGRTTSKL